MQCSICRERSPYDRWAWLYDALVHGWSLGAVGRAKRLQARRVKPGERVLCVGAGTGEDVAMAVRHGADVTCIDMSRAMCQRTQRRLEDARVSATVIHGDIFLHSGEYDRIIVGFMLEGMTADVSSLAIEHMATLLRPSGTMSIASIALPQGSVPARIFTMLHHWIALGVAHMLGFAPAYPLRPWRVYARYDYPAMMQAAGLRVTWRDELRLWPRGPVVYQIAEGVRQCGG